jgi:hypothetical protein
MNLITDPAAKVLMPIKSKSNIGWITFRKAAGFEKLFVEPLGNICLETGISVLFRRI